MKGYKFVHSEYIDDILNLGCLRFSTLSHFAENFEPGAIGDDREGRARSLMRHVHVSAADTPESRNLRRNLARDGIRIGRGHAATFISSEVERRLPDRFVIYCVSIDPYDSVRKAFCEDAKENERKDACVEISDLDLLVQCIKSTGTLDPERKVPFSRQFVDIDHDVVGYTNRDTDYLNDTQIMPSLFIKTANYSYQQEYRIVLVAHDYVLKPITNIYIQPPAGLFIRKL